MTTIDDFLNYDEIISEMAWIDHYVGGDLQEQGGIAAAKRNRSRLLCADPDRYPLAATIGCALKACSTVRPCRLPYCPDCRGSINRRERERTADRFRGVAPERLRFLTVNLQVIALDSSPSGFHRMLAKMKRRIQDRLNRFRIPGRKITAKEAGVRLLGCFELSPIKTDDSVCLLLHLHALLDMGVLGEDDYRAVFGRYTCDFADDAGAAIPKRYDGDNRLHACPLDVVKYGSKEASLKNLGGYSSKLSLKFTLGDLNGPVLRAIVERVEAVRGRGMEGLRFQFGLSKKREGVCSRRRGRGGRSGVLTGSSSDQIVDSSLECGLKYFDSKGDDTSSLFNNSDAAVESEFIDCNQKFQLPDREVHISAVSHCSAEVASGDTRAMP